MIAIARMPAFHIGTRHMGGGTDMSMTSACYGESSMPQENLDKLMALQMEDKVIYSKMIIQRFYIHQRGKVYVSYSGGKDSTVLLDLVRSLYPEVPAVYSDTGLEFPEIREFVKNTPNVTMIRPEMSFREVIKTRGYPVVGKEVAHIIDAAQRGVPYGLKMTTISRDETTFSKAHYAWLVDAPFRISSDCCKILKKKPMHVYEQESGRHAIIGTKGIDSRLRMTNLQNLGSIQNEKCTPLGIWTNEDIWQYIQSRDLPYCKIYDEGYNATGCIFCAFGIMQDRNRFVRLKATHPKQWEYCMRPLDKGGLGMEEVCDFLGIPTGRDQTFIKDFVEESQ